MTMTPIKGGDYLANKLTTITEDQIDQYVKGIKTATKIYIKQNMKAIGKDTIVSLIEGFMDDDENANHNDQKIAIRLVCRKLESDPDFPLEIVEREIQA